MSGYGTYSEVDLDSNGNYEWWNSTSLLWRAWWLSIHMIAKTTGLFWGGDVLYLKWDPGCWLFRYLGVSVGSLPWRFLNWFVFLLRLFGRKLRPQNAGISLVSNSFTEFVNNLLSNAESFNNWLESCCIIFGWRCRIKIMISLTWSGQGSWGSNNL